MNETEIKSILAHWNLKWDDFIKWMTGRTFTKDDNGNAIYYEIDVRAFIRSKIIKTDWNKID